jgi:hypothetical protein
LPRAEESHCFIYYKRLGAFAKLATTYLGVGMGVEVEPESGPKGPRTAKITVTLMETPAVLSFNELAASFQRHAAG